MNTSSSDILDELIVLRCKRRDVAAWDELVLRWNGRLYYYLQSNCGSWNFARDNSRVNHCRHSANGVGRLIAASPSR